MKTGGYDVTYDPDTYPGINAKINGISVFIFGTGNVVITGAKMLKGIQKTLETVTNIFNANKNINLRQGKGMKKEKKLVTYSNGYNENLYNACLV
jgi:TATA-box binding protein (TBP) (component of TFIID and TFIIIB)